MLFHKHVPSATLSLILALLAATIVWFGFGAPAPLPLHHALPRQRTGKKPLLPRRWTHFGTARTSPQ